MFDSDDGTSRREQLAEWVRKFHMCGVYTRQSRESKDEYSSCESQSDACRAFVKARHPEGWVYNGQRYDDMASSSETLDRPGLKKLFQHIREGKVQRVVVLRLDRLSRRIEDCTRLLQDLHNLKVPLTIIKQPELGTSANDALLLNLMASFTEFEQQMTRDRLADARAALKQRGRRVAGVVPYGYDSDPVTKQLLLAETEAQRVRQMFAMAAEGKKPTEIATFANDHGWRTKERTSKSGRVTGGNRWTARQVLAVLSNPVYAGKIRDGDTTRQGRHEPLIEQELFDTVREIIASRRTSSRKKQSTVVEWPLRGILRCGQCGRPLSPSISGYKQLRYRYYRCRSDAGGQPACKGVSLPAYEIETFAITTIGELNSSESLAGLDDESAKQYEQLAAIWQQLSLNEQGKLIPQLVQEVVFDSEQSTISVTLNSEAVEEFVQATRL